MGATVIIGAGIIGCATAYYLSETEGVDPASIHLVEAAPAFFASCSGKAAGFVAGDWFGKDTLPLGKLSLALHRKLAAENDGLHQWGFSPSTGISHTEASYKLPEGEAGPHDWLTNGTSRSSAAGQHEFASGTGPAWLTHQQGDKIGVISEYDSVAQVDPLRLSQFLLKQSKARGVQVHQPARVTKVTLDEQQQPSAVTIAYTEGKTIDVSCSKVLLAAGAWTPRIFEQLFPSADLKLSISPYAGHSIVLRSPRYKTEDEALGCHAVFTTMSNGLSPEIMSRIGGELWVAGLNSDKYPLPDLPNEAIIDKEAIDELMVVSKKIMGSGTDVDDLELVREGLCFRPVTPAGVPILAKIKGGDLAKGASADAAGAGGVYVAAGHGPWGIAMSLGTGKVMSELLLGRETSADISGLGLQKGRSAGLCSNVLDVNK